MTKQDIDLQKVQALESSYQGRLSTAITFSMSMITGIFLLILTAVLENLLTLPVMMGLMTVPIVLLAYTIWTINRMNKWHTQWINLLMARIENGERLDSLEKVREQYASNPNNQIKKSNGEVKSKGKN